MLWIAALVLGGIHLAITAAALAQKPRLWSLIYLSTATGVILLACSYALVSA